MKNTEKQEVWKIYPEFPWIEASNLGRVRTKDRVVTGKDGKKYHIKGRILKQRLRSDGYVDIHFGVNGKIVNLLVHRVVAASFLPNPKNLPEVNHKDNNPKNNAVSNLEWCDRQYNIDYKNNFGTTSAQVLGRPIYAVNLETGKVLWFETQSEAARQLGVDSSSINAVVKGKLNQAGGYWFTEDDSEITEKKIQEVRASMHFLGGVIAINLDNFEVLWFKQQSEAARQLGVSVGYINGVVKGLYNKAKGFWFCYANGDTVKKVRAKFGNEVAEKVEELMKECSN